MPMEEFKFPDEIENEGVPAKDDDTFEIEVIDDTPAKDQGRKPLDREVEDPTDDEIESYSDKVKGRIKELTHARHDERRAKEALLREKQERERLTQALLDENRALKQHVATGTEQFSRMAQSAAEGELNQARAALKAAQEAFDTDAIVAAQEALTDAKMRINAARNIPRPPVQERQDVVQQQQFAQPQEEPDEKSLRWQAKNQWFSAPGFEEVTAFALGLSQKLLNSGVDPRSDSYYESIDSRLRSTFPKMFRESRQQSEDSPRKPATVVAPATRSTGAKRVQLTTTQMNLAKKYGLTPQQYAAEVLKLENTNG
jgi:hypothetical protein